LPCKSGQQYRKSEKEAPNYDQVEPIFENRIILCQLEQPPGSKPRFGVKNLGMTLRH
jgi:hypothetical protein